MTPTGSSPTPPHSPARASAATRSLPGLHEQVLDALGGDICAGRLTPGSVLTLQRIEERFGVSRSVGRETIRVLDSMRLVVSRRRVGVVVLPPDEWNLFDPRVVHWRLQAPDRDAQIAALAELRIAVEPEAARLAATRATSAEVAELVSIAGRMWAAGEDEDRERFHELDLGFHSLVLVASRNGMFSRLESVISDTLTGRREHGLGPDQPLPVSLGLHAEVSAAIQRRDPTVSFSSMRRLLLQSVAESMPHRGDRRS